MLKKPFFYSLLFYFLQFNSVYCQEIESNNHYIPGTLHLYDNLYIDQSPVTNLEYLFFLQNIKSFWSVEKHDSIKNFPSYNLNLNTNSKNILPDNMPLYIQMSLNGNLKVDSKLKLYDYLNYPSYSDFPVIYITKKQAQTYCLWRTDLVMLNWASKSKTEKERLSFPKKVKYRLPTYKEFQYAIKYFKERNSLIVSKEKSLLKFKVKNNKSNDFFIANISEFTKENTPFGENWKVTAEITSHNDYTGFRCICEVTN